MPGIQPSGTHTIFPELLSTINKMIADFHVISSGRKDSLHRLAALVKSKTSCSETAKLNFICTHNSRRSHMAQLWAQTAAYYYDINGVLCYSGGTEATSFNPRAVRAMSDLGFRISKKDDNENPVYEVTFSPDAAPISAFSKKYDDPANPSDDFAAIMTCSHADANCPMVIGASQRIAITYEDPKDFDGTAAEASVYHTRALQIGTEMFFAFSCV